MLVDMWAMGLAKKFELSSSAEGLVRTSRFELTAAALHVGALARNIVLRASPFDVPPDALLPAVLSAMIEPVEGQTIRALRVCRAVGPEMLNVARTCRPDQAPTASQTFALAPDKGALPLNSLVEVKFLYWQPSMRADALDTGLGLAVLSQPKQMSTACLTWRRRSDGLEIRLDKRRPECAALEPYRLGNGLARPLLAKAGNNPHRVIARFEAMLTAGRILHNAFRQIGCLAPVPKIAPRMSLNAAIDAIEAGATLADVETAVDARGILE